MATHPSSLPLLERRTSFVHRTHKHTSYGPARTLAHDETSHLVEVLVAEAALEDRCRHPRLTRAEVTGRHPQGEHLRGPPAASALLCLVHQELASVR